MKMGMIGAGFISRFQVTAMQQVRGWEISAVLKRGGSEALAEAVRRSEMGRPKIVDSVREVVENCDVVAIYSPNYTRVETMEEIVDTVRGGATLKGLICEKPLGRNVREARRMVELAAETGVPTAYFENQLFMKPLRTQLDQLQGVQEVMGPLALVRSSEEHAGPHEPWFWDPVRQGGGVLNDMGCHSIAVGWYALTPTGKPLQYLKPTSVSAEVALLKWGRPKWRRQLQERHGIDYGKTPAEDFATGMITYQHPEGGPLCKAQFTNSWMFEKQGLRIFADGIGPGYAFEINTLVSPSTAFIGDEAAEAIADQEKALEKATASRGLLTIQYNEADLYGYTDENLDALEAFRQGRDAMLPWDYGLEVTRLVMAAYKAAEERRTVDLTDPKTLDDLETYVPAIARGEGAGVLGV